MLLHKRYGDHSLQEVPDRHGGDLGIEAYSLDGCAFQCYAALEPLSTNDLYESQRTKLTADLNKLYKNKVELKRILRDLRIGKYVFMVHRNDSRHLLAHASNKATEVLGWELDFIAPDFRIMVVTDNDYPVEREAIVAIPQPIILVDGVTEDHKSSWANANFPLLDGATRKLRAVGLEGEALAAALDTLILEFLTGENALQRLRERYPDHWEAAQACKSRRERRLALEFPASANASMKVVVEVVDALRLDLARDAPSMSGLIAETVSWGVVADWIMRCPLDFEAV
jgi:hypothetical protein